MIHQEIVKFMLLLRIEVPMHHRAVGENDGPCFIFFDQQCPFDNPYQVGFREDFCQGADIKTLRQTIGHTALNCLLMLGHGLRLPDGVCLQNNR